MWGHAGTNLQVQNMFLAPTVRGGCQTIFGKFLAFRFIYFQSLFRWMTKKQILMYLRRQGLWHFTSRSNPVELALLSAGVCMRGVETARTEQKALKRASKGIPNSHWVTALLAGSKLWSQTRLCPCLLPELVPQVCPSKLSNPDTKMVSTRLCLFTQ